MVHRFLSMKPEWIEVVNEIQRYWELEPKSVYQFYTNVIPKGRTFLRYTKSKKKSKIESGLWIYYVIILKKVQKILKKHLTLWVKMLYILLYPKYGVDEKKTKKYGVNND